MTNTNYINHSNSNNSNSEQDKDKDNGKEWLANFNYLSNYAKEKLYQLQAQQLKQQIKSPSNKSDV